MNDIKKDVDELFEELKSSALYKNYESAKNQLEENNEIKKIINEIKRLQKIVANNDDYIVENNIKELYKELDNYPLYQSYKEIKEELQMELLYISREFNHYFHDILKLETESF